VADGLGGHRNGEVASRMVCDALADFVPDAGFDQMIEAAKERLERVNEYLQRDAAASDEGGAGSTVVALFARGSRFAVLWAGDSRMYRLRDGLLEQVTEDHSLAAVDAVAASGESVNAITRAVGGEAHLALDQRRDRVRPGDRFLLCSDGLTRTVSEEQIARCMEQEDVRLVVDGLIQATLDNGAPDNVTALVVEAFS
jgi:serine/threonine protein phosphatase PrpC